MWLTPLTIVTFHKTPVWWLWFTETFRSMTCVQSTGKYKVPTYVRRISNVFFFYLCMCRERDMHRSALRRLAYDPVCMCLTRCDRIVWPPYENSITTFKPCFKNISSTPSLLGYFFFLVFFYLFYDAVLPTAAPLLDTKVPEQNVDITSHDRECERVTIGNVKSMFKMNKKKNNASLSLSLSVSHAAENIFVVPDCVPHILSRE